MLIVDTFSQMRTQNSFPRCLDGGPAIKNYYLIACRDRHFETSQNIGSEKL